MIVFAESLKTKVVITLKGQGTFHIERLHRGVEGWAVWKDGAFTYDDIEPDAVQGVIIDLGEFEDGLYTYRAVSTNVQEPEPEDYSYSNWVRCGKYGPVGWTFGNYEPAPGQWGEVCTPDDLRLTWLWGTDFKATNGQSYTDEQIIYFINSAVAEVGRLLGITIKKTRVRCNAEERGLVKGQDYDESEAMYDFRRERIQRYGLISTRKKPVAKLHSLKLIARHAVVHHDLTDSVILDKTKGLLKFMQRPIKASDTITGIQTAINPYGSELMNPYLFYAIDYDAGYASASDIPDDLRQCIGKVAAISLLNIIGDGLMSGFSSSSLSMDGISESFSSTQSATSAYFGARVAVYQKEVQEYIQEVQRKFGHFAMGSI